MTEFAAAVNALMIPVRLPAVWIVSEDEPMAITVPVALLVGAAAAPEGSDSAQASAARRHRCKQLRRTNPSIGAGCEEEERA